MRSSYHILAVFLLCLLFPRLNASCFEAVKPLGDIGNIRAHSICQDNTGAIWISTNLGLFSYDGINTTIHPVSCEKYKHSSSLIHHLVYNPAENNLYMLLHGYLMSYNLVNGNSKELSTQPFYNLKQGKGRLLTSNQDSLFEYADNHISLLYTLPEKDIITAILEDENGIFLGTRNSGLLFLNKERQLTSFAPHFKEIISLFKDSDSNLWASSDGHGLMRFALQQGGSDHRQYTAESGSLLSNSVREVNEDNEKNLWVATSEGVNVFALSGTPIRGYSKRSDTRTGLTELSIWSVFKDKYGSMWFGSYPGDVFVHHPAGAPYESLIGEDPLLQHTRMLGKMTKGEEGSLWIASEWNGLFRYDLRKKTYTRYTHIPGNRLTITSDNISDLFYDNERGCLWIGCHRSGLCYYDPARKQIIRIHDQNYPQINTEQISSFTPVNGKIAFATTSGIFAYDYAPRKIELLDKRLQGYYTNLCKDSLNRLWLTRTNALICYDPASGDINRYPYQISSGEELILLSKNLLSDSNGNIWFTTRGDGVFCFDPESKTFRMFNEHNCGLKGRISYAIRELSPGLMLISTNKGLSILNTSQRTCVNLSSEKGFPLTSMSPGDILQEKGEIYLSGKEGLFRIDSTHLFSANTDFNLWFSQLKINNRLVFPSETNSPLSKMISHSDKLVLNHKHTIVSFLFASDQYQKTAHTDFQYKLEGFDQQWQTAPANRELTYMNLPPGKYTLRVRGYSPLQPEHQKTIKLDVDILPHPLKSSWAYLCYGIIFIISAGLIIKLLYGRLKLKNSLYFAEKEKRHIEATNQSKINFFTNISHELRTPLTLITGQLQMVLHSDTILPSLRGRISNIHQNANRMQQLINELLDFQKQEQEGLTLKITEENIPPFIEDIFLSFKDYALFKGITYTFDKPADDFKTWIDPVQFRKILFNLLSNAFKYCNENGHIALRLQKEDTAFSIEVTDSGPGIPENAREKIFDRFYQIEQSSASNPQIIGTGIGLSVTKGIVEAHGGSISVKSEPGNGSTFTVSIPFDPSKFGKSEIISQTTQPLNNKTAIHSFNPEDEDYQAEITLLKKQINPDIKILLVEDNRELQEMLCRIFGQFSEVFCAENGLEGLQKTTEIQPDLIISDIMMPQMSGVEMCRQIKANPTLSHIPVILLTARSSAGQNIEGLKSGADDFISKPFNLSVLITRCMNLLLSRQMLREKFTKEFDAKPRIITSSETDQQLLEKVIRIIEENMENESFSIPLLAKALTMSQSSFTNKLKALTNQTPLDFVMTIRLRKGAQLLLAHPDTKISVIAGKTGFTNPKYFTGSFKELFGQTPSQYRKNNGIEN